MKITNTVDVPSVTMHLDREMTVTVSDSGRVIVRQGSRQVGPDQYDMGGEYEFLLPSVRVIAEKCSARDDPDLDTGTATIEVIHNH